LASSDRFLVVGAGLVGLASAYQLLKRRPGCSVTVLEKEQQVCVHQSGRNSGVLHAGLAYAPGSAKALLARRGLRSMAEFCAEHGIAYAICGKLIVATHPEDVPRLAALREQGERNGLGGLRILSRDQALEIEPHVGGVGALHVPGEGIVDYRSVGRTLASLVARGGGRVVTGARVERVRRNGSGWHVETRAGDFSASALVNCAGLYADRVCRLAGGRPSVTIVPFRGEYWRVRSGPASLVRALIYPLPDRQFPFLGVHLTRRIDGTVDAGPNAVLALAREGYSWSAVNVRDTVEALSFPGLWRFIARYPRQSWSEVKRSFSKTLFSRALRALVPELSEDDLIRGGAGVRAQAVARDGSLVQDFVFQDAPGAVHVLNAPSPAATASLAIGEAIAARVAP
jgi:(S)-2-hydroxyglutarate dehydrogenase